MGLSSDELFEEHAEGESDEVEDEDNPTPTCNSKKRTSSLSIKDASVIVILSMFLSMGLVIWICGVEEVKEKFYRNDVWDIIIALIFFVGIFAFITYILVKMAVHYLLYVAIGTLLAIVFPVSPRKQRSELRNIFRRAEKQA